jgi:putative addiction module component (TIGR02574 family)
MDKAKALREIERWPLDDQIEFVQTVWERIVQSGWQPRLTQEQEVELDRRLDDLDANPGNVVTWEEIIDHVRRQR